MGGWRRGAWLIVTALLFVLCFQVVEAQERPPELETLHKRALELYQAKKFTDAIPIVEEYLAAAAAGFGEQHPHYATGLGYLADLYQMLNRPSEAEPLLKRAVAIKEKSLGPDHAQAADALYDLAEFYRKQGRLSAAEPLYQRVLSIGERAVGPEHPSIGIVLGNMAELYRAQERYAEAESFHKRSVSIREKTARAQPDVAAGPDESADLQGQVRRFYAAGKYGEAAEVAQLYVAAARTRHGEDHTEYATAISWLAYIYRAQGRHAEAEPLYKRSLAILEGALGANDPGVGITLNNLADLYRQQGRYPEAEPLYKRALGIREKALGPDHPDVGTSLSGLATLYQSQGRYAEAEPLERRALNIFEKKLAPNHPMTGLSLTQLASITAKLGRNAEAEQLLRRSLALNEIAYGAEHLTTAAASGALAKLVQEQWRYNEAEALYQRALSMFERSQDHPRIADTVSNMASLYHAQGRYSEAELFYRRALAINERTLGAEHPGTAITVNNLAGVLRAQARFGEAESLYKRALDISEKTLGPEHPDMAATFNNLAGLYEDQGRYGEAEPLYRRGLVIAEKAFGPEHPDVALKLSNLAGLYQHQGRYTEAETVLKRSLAVDEKVLGPEHPSTATTLNNLASVFLALGRYSEAEEFFRRALAIDEKVFGRENPNVATPLNNLATVFKLQGRLGESQGLLERALALREKVLGPEHPDTISTLNNLASVMEAQGRYNEAEAHYRRALAIREKVLGLEHASVAIPLNNLALLYLNQRRFGDAEPLFVRALAVKEKALGSLHLETALAASNLALLYASQSRLAEAEPLYLRALTIRETSLSTDHPDIANSLLNLAWLESLRQNWSQSLALFRRSSDVYIKRGLQYEQGVTRPINPQDVAVTPESQFTFLKHVSALWQVALQGNEPRRELEDEAFRIGQRASHSEAGGAIAQMSTRSGTRDSTLIRLVRERQDLAGEWWTGDKLLIAAISKPESQRVASAENEQRTRLAAIDARIAEIDRGLAKDFPDYAALANPEPLSIAETQAQLHAEEALVLFLDTPEKAFVWVVTKTGSRWLRIDVGTKWLAQQVQALRCGLDRAAWNGEGTLRCSKLLEVHGIATATKEDEPLPFDIARAHDFYELLFGQVADLIDGKRLLIVPSGPLTSLPFNVLVTAAPRIAIPVTFADYREVAWLGARQPITVLPSVASLQALRQHAKRSRATKAYFGIGNPVLDGDPTVAWQVERARKARDRQHCPETGGERVAAVTGAHVGLKPLARGGLAAIADIRRQLPLPETRDELCAVVLSLGVPESEIRLGAKATETEVKALSADGRLADYRVVHFATHGTMSGEIKGGAEPGLILTPPDEATAEDDGYLSISEIAALKLNADWVILSACNTAGGSTETAEALSGMARAFFYAGARALLVSHWAVDSDATVKLITQTLSTMAADRSVGRSEALRRSMLALIEKGEAYEAHPAYWAPFVVVGEGSADSTPQTIPSITRPETQPSPKAKTNRPTRPSKKTVTPLWQTEVWR
jgi:tetratricopeptide (TPR) repeat protein/CHAT domain-containing protein